MELTAETDLDSLFGDVDAGTVRTSEQRRSELEKWARGIAGQELSLTIETDDGPAKVDYTMDPPEISIPGRAFDQPVTNLDRKPFDALMQYSLTLHEVGHLLYTDEDVAGMALSEVDPGYQEQFRQFWNALEDGAIEEQLRRDFGVAGELGVMNANISGTPTGELGLLDAILGTCLDLGVYDTGTLRQLADPDDESVTFASDEDRETFIDEIFEEIVDTVADVRTEPDPGERVARTLEAWQEIEPHLDTADNASGEKINVDDGHPAPADGNAGATRPMDTQDQEALQDRFEELLESVEGVGTPDDLEGGTATSQGDTEGPDDQSGSGGETDTQADSTGVPGEDRKRENQPTQSGETTPEYGDGQPHDDQSDTTTRTDTEPDPETAEETTADTGEAERGRSETTADEAGEDGSTTDAEAGVDEQAPADDSSAQDETGATEGTQSGESTAPDAENEPGSDTEPRSDNGSVSESGTDDQPQPSEQDRTEGSSEASELGENGEPQATPDGQSEASESRVQGDGREQGSRQDQAPSESESDAESTADSGDDSGSQHDSTTEATTEDDAGNEGCQPTEPTETEPADAENPPNSSEASTPGEENEEQGDQDQTGGESAQESQVDAQTANPGEQEVDQSEGSSDPAESSERADQSTESEDSSTDGDTQQGASSDDRGGGEFTHPAETAGTSGQSPEERDQSAELDDEDGEVWTDDIDSDPTVDESVKDHYESLADEQFKQEQHIQDRIKDELDELRETADEVDDIRLNELTVVEGPHLGQFRKDDVSDIRQDSRQLANVLERQLQREQRSEFRNDRRRGTIDTRVAHRLEYHDFRVFKDEISPDEKDYEAAIVLDRSGSMQDGIKGAERATATFAMALEEIGVDTCLIDMYLTEPRVVKPFEAPVERNLDAILTGDHGGGTPITPCLQLARNHLEQRASHPFLIIVTDGRPKNEDQYREAIMRTNFPVLGVYMDFDASGIDDVRPSVRESGALFDQRRIITDQDQLLSSLRRLCQNVMF